MTYDVVMDFHILGRKIGTYTGWDQSDPFTIQIYDFVPVEEVNLPAVDLMTFSLDNGKVEWFDNVPDSDEKFNWKAHYHWRDLVDIVKDVPFLPSS